jgi:hypothetical protein
MVSWEVEIKAILQQASPAAYWLDRIAPSNHVGDLDNSVWIPDTYPRGRGESSGRLDDEEHQLQRQVGRTPGNNTSSGGENLSHENTKIARCHVENPTPMLEAQSTRLGPRGGLYDRG